MSRLLRPLADAATYRALLFYVAELGLGLTGFTLVVAAWPITLTLAITPLVVPLLIGLGFAVAGLAAAEAYLVRTLLRAPTQSAPPAAGSGFWGRGFRVVQHAPFWKQQAHLLVSWPIALIPLSLLTLGLQLVTLPVWYRWVASADVLWRSNVDTFPETLPFAALGLALLVVLAQLLRPLTWLSRRLAKALLSSGPVRSPAEVSRMRLRILTVLAVIAGAIVTGLVAIWALTGAGTFWPIWPFLSLALVVGSVAWTVYVVERPQLARHTMGSVALAIQLGISGALLAFLVGVWAAAGRGYFWPIWVAVGLALAAIAHGALVQARRQHRIETLETSRAGAVDVQETELRRIERDLHDGAQARLVALGMSLGMAEQQLGTDPEAVRTLITEARLGVAEALQELRDLARGIHPPILADRGLEAAVGTLSAHSPVPVSVSVDIADRPPAPVETAAYFTVAEALANAIKHADAARIDIRIQRSNGVLVAEIVDDGDGGADPRGRGLTGLRQRAQALDGTLRVESPAGGPTRVRVELPCGS